MHVYRGVKLHIGGDMKPALRWIHTTFLEEMLKQFANRPILRKPGWLYISKWPANELALESHGVGDLKAVFEHWQHRFPSMIWRGDAGFDQMKVVYKAALRPVDSCAFLKHIICNKAPFPCLHVLLQCCLALAPGDAVVEQAFPSSPTCLPPSGCALAPNWLSSL